MQIGRKAPFEEEPFEEALFEEKKQHLKKHYLKTNIYTLFRRKAIAIQIDSKSCLEAVAPVADTMCFDQSAPRVEVEINWIG